MDNRIGQLKWDGEEVDNEDDFLKEVSAYWGSEYYKDKEPYWVKKSALGNVDIFLAFIAVQEPLLLE